MYAYCGAKGLQFGLLMWHYTIQPIKATDMSSQLESASVKEMH